MEKKTTQKKIESKTASKSRASKADKVLSATADLSATVFSTGGKEVGTTVLPASVFGISWNPDLVHQVALGMQANARAGQASAHTKMRGEVRGGGKKPWRQKGTGRARHGSIRSPIWRGGGVTHGPRADKEYGVRIPRKMRTKALFSVLSKKFSDGLVLFVDGLSFSEPKTKDARSILGALAGISGFEKMTKKSGNAALFVIPKNDENVKKSFRNIGTTGVEDVRNLNALDVLLYKYIVIANPDVSVKILSEKQETKNTDKQIKN